MNLFVEVKLCEDDSDGRAQQYEFIIFHPGLEDTGINT